MEGEREMSELAEKAPSRRSPRKSKRNQIPYGLIVIVLMVVFGIRLYNAENGLVMYWIFGIAFGYVLQRSRFCFAAAFRDPFLTGGTSLTRAILVAFAVGTVGFLVVLFVPTLTGAEINLDLVDATPIGLPLVLGGILFGIGMVIASGCASGALMRVGEGFTMQGLVLVFFIIGSLLGVRDTEIWDGLNEQASEVFLPDVFGWLGAVIVQFSMIVLLYIAAVKWQKKKEDQG